MGSSWERIKQLVADAAERPPAERESYVREHCPDPDVLREVIALLATPAPLSDIVSAGALSPGTRLGVYVVERRIGCGGMGEVYRARDSRLGRSVAIKVLPPLFADDAERLARFEREGRLLASLNHPNICTLFDVGRHGGTSFIAMELLEGHTLREHIGGTSLDLPELLELGIQITGALDATHQKCVVHRDIKPSNIFVTDRGQAKMLDVGLAKAHGPNNVRSPGHSGLATMNAESLTDAGMALGTVAYMSPEQARGEDLDSRTDLFSFGAVLYEMATGRPPFVGATDAIVFDAVLNKTPAPPGQLNPAVPSALDRVIAKALEKDRELRYQTAADVRSDLRRITLDTEPPRTAARPAAVAHRLRRSLRYASVLALLLAIAAIGRWTGFLNKSADRSASTQWSLLTDFPDSAVWPALSADGSMLTFVRGPLPSLTRGQIYVKLLPDGDARQLTTDERPKMRPVFSPDRSRITYTAGDDTWAVPVLGGEPRLLLQNATGLTWIDANHAVYAERMDDSRMGIVTSTESRTEHRDLYVTPSGAVASFSAVSPDRRWVVIAGRMDHDVRQPCLVVPFDGRTAAREVGIPGAPCLTAAWSPDGRVIYLELLGGTREAHIWRQAFPAGAAEQITAGPTVEHGIAVAPDGASLVASVGKTHLAMWLHDQNGDRPISTAGVDFVQDGAFFSPGGGRVYHGGTSQDQLLVADLRAGGTTPVFPGLTRMQNYCVSSDEQLAGVVLRVGTGVRELWIGALDHATPPRKLGPVNIESCAIGGPHQVYILKRDQQGVNAMYRVDAETGTMEKVVSGVQELFSISHDGDWAAFAVGRDKSALTVARLLAGGDDVSMCRDCRARWSPDGRFMYIWYPDATSIATQRMHVLPVAPGATPPIPQVFASGPKSETELIVAIKGVPGATTIEREDAVRIVPGPNPATYAFLRMTTQRNLYRIPFR